MFPSAAIALDDLAAEVVDDPGDDEDRPEGVAVHHFPRRRCDPRGRVACPTRLALRAFLARRVARASGERWGFGRSPMTPPWVPVMTVLSATGRWPRLDRGPAELGVDAATPAPDGAEEPPH